MRNINDRLQEMTEKINSKNILETSSLGNEINFRVFDYDPEDEYIVRDYLYNYLVKRNKNIIVFDIYDIIIKILREKGFLGKTFEYEKQKGTKYVNSVIQKTLAISSNSDLLVKYIRERLEENKIILITGLGKCYGIVRGHTILNNLHSVITNNPVIMLYPGIYDGQSFKLFKILDNDNYYRAFQLVSRK